MAYNQGKNPFRSKSPLHHGVRDRKSGTNLQHFHDPTNKSKIYTSDQKVITGSDKFGTQSGRVKDDITGKRTSEEEYAREYARQLSSAYNSGRLNDGQFLADDLYKRNRKLSFKKGELKLKSGYKGIDKGKMFNLGYATANEDGGYTAPETQYTEDQIYDMMVQGGGLVSIVDGQIVSGNPNETMGQGFDNNNRINTWGNDFEKMYETSDIEDWADNNQIGEIENNQMITVGQLNAEKKRIQEEKKAEILQKNEEKKRLWEEKKANQQAELEREKMYAKMLENRERIDREGGSPVNNNSPLHQGQEVDSVSGNPLDGFNYIPGEPVDTVTIQDVYGPDGTTVIGTDTITNTKTNFQGNKPAPPPPPPPPDGTPDFKEDCEGIVMNIGAYSKSGYYKCDTKPTPIGGGSTEIVPPEDDTHSYDELSTKTVYTPNDIPPPPPPPVETVPEPEPNLFNLSGGSIRKGGFDLNLKLQFPDWQDMGDIVRRAKGMIFTRSGRCTSGCATNNPK